MQLNINFLFIYYRYLHKFTSVALASSLMQDLI